MASASAIPGYKYGGMSQLALQADRRFVARTSLSGPPFHRRHFSIIY